MQSVGAYKHFGVMLDCSRNAVMKVNAVKRMIDCLQKMGYNTLELYTEDTYEIKTEPYFGYLRGRYTGAELKELDAYATARGVELIPCVQTLAHFTALVRNGEYRKIMDCNDILLIDEPKTYELIEKIFATLAENFTSRNVNIGMDEAHMVGLGKYLDKHGFVNRFDLLIRHLHKVTEIAEKYGFKPHMWSDMFFRLACKGEYYEPHANISQEIKNAVPKNVALTYWDYYHDDTDFYNGMIEKHFEFNREVWFAGGAYSWNGGIAPMNAFSLKVMKPAMQSVREKKIENVLITMWGDNGRECSFFSLLPALYSIRQYADGNTDEESIKKGFYQLFGVRYDDFMLLDIPNKLDIDELTMSNPSKCLLYTDPFMGILDKTLETVPTIPFAEFAATLRKTSAQANEFSYIFETLSKLCDVLAIKAYFGINVRRAYQAKDKNALKERINDCKEMVVRLEVFHKAFYTSWHKENKPQGWEIQDARIGGLIQRVKTCAGRLQEYVDGQREVLEELEEELLLTEQYLCNNAYKDLISRSML